MLKTIIAAGLLFCSAFSLALAQTASATSATSSSSGASSSGQSPTGGASQSSQPALNQAQQAPSGGATGTAARGSKIGAPTPAEDQAQSDADKAMQICKGC